MDIQGFNTAMNYAHHRKTMNFHRHGGVCCRC